MEDNQTSESKRDSSNNSESPSPVVPSSNDVSDTASSRSSRGENPDHDQSSEQHEPLQVVQEELRVPLPKWYPHWRGKPIYNGNGVAFGWALDSMGRAVAFAAAGAFLFTALLRLAKEAAGCETDPPPGSNKVPECNGKVYGIRPSSMLSIFNIVVGLFSAILLPIMGAVVDYTNKRLIMGKVTSVIICLLMIPSLFISSQIWFPIALLQLVIAFVGWAQSMVTYAYLPELTKSERELNQFTKSFTILSFASMILVLGGVVGVAQLFGFGNDDVQVARLGQAVSLVVTSIALYPAWFQLLQPRPASHTLPEGQSLWTVGFRQVYRTSKYIFRNLRALMWFYISVSFTDAAVGSLGTVAITYMTDTLSFSTQEGGIAFLAILIGSIPGAFIAGYAASWGDPRISSLMATCVFAVNTIAAGLVLSGPGQQLEGYAFAFVWGCAGGWKWTTDRVLAATLIPIGQDAELMGTYLFSGQILTWLPPLVFTLMNEAGLSERIGLASISFWFVLGVLCLYLIGDYRKGVSAAGRGYILSNLPKPSKGMPDHPEEENDPELVLEDDDKLEGQ